MRRLSGVPEFVTNIGILALLTVFILSVSPLQFRIPFHEIVLEKSYLDLSAIELFVLATTIVLGLALAANCLANRLDISALGRAIGFARSNWVVFSSLLSLSAAGYIGATALTWYSYIPGWVPSYPAVYGPPNPSFEVYALIWKIHPNWLIALNAEHFLHLLITVPLIAVNGTILISIGKSFFQNRFHFAGLASGASLSALGLFGCCSPYLLLLLGSGLFLTIAGLGHALSDLGTVVLASNLVLLGRQLPSKVTRID